MLGDGLCLKGPRKCRSYVRAQPSPPRAPLKWLSLRAAGKGKQSAPPRTRASALTSAGSGVSWGVACGTLTAPSLLEFQGSREPLCGPPLVKRW